MKATLLKHVFHRTERHGTSAWQQKVTVDTQNPKKFADIHCHCLFGLDDGPATLAGSVALCSMLAKDGVEVVVATPHQMGRYGLRNEPEIIRRAVFDLNKELQRQDIRLEVLPGGDVHVDERLCELLSEDKILTVADKGKYLLVELPFEVFIDIEPMLRRFSGMGVNVIISHPERYVFSAISEEVLDRWSNYSVGFQLTAGSFRGDFGKKAQDLAWDYLHTSVPCCLATDSHDTRSRKPRMRQAYEMIAAKEGQQAATVVCVENPQRIIRSESMLSHRNFDKAGFGNAKV